MAEIIEFASYRRNCSRRVLLVKDEFLIRTALAECLRDCSFEAIEAASASQAIGMIRTYGRLDLVFTDLETNGDMTGLDLADWIQHHRPGLPVILVSNDLDRLSQRDTSAALILAKPFDIESTVGDIAQIIAEYKTTNGTTAAI